MVDSSLHVDGLPREGSDLIVDRERYKQKFILTIALIARD
jgi:hypothetical protein